MAPNCIVVGDVVIAHEVIVSYGCVIRGDENVVSIYPGTVIQENCVITADAAVSNMSLDTDGEGGRVVDFPGEVVIEAGVQIGPGCVLRACKIQQDAVIGAGSIICEVPSPHLPPTPPPSPPACIARNRSGADSREYS